MKNFRLYIPLSLLTAFILLSGTLRTNGSPGGYTGSPLDGSSCTECHSSSTSNVNWIATNIPEEGYVPGTTYTITASAADGSSSKMGFEVTAENNVSKLGTFIITDNSRTQLTNGNKSVTHSRDGTTAAGGSATWTMEWTAPAAGAGDVNMYGAFNIANSNGNSGGDKIFLSSLLINENVSTNSMETDALISKVYPNPSSGNFTISTEAPIISVSIYDLKGQVLKTLNKVPNSSYSLDFSYLKAGTYVIKTETSEGTSIRKIQIR